MPKVSELEYRGLDEWHRPTYQSKATKAYYCLPEAPDYPITPNEILESNLELYFKGYSREGEPEYPVTLVSE